MNRRAFYFDKWNTWHDWRCTLTAKDLTPPEPKTKLVSIEGGHGSLDLSEALTGEPVYDVRKATASFLCSEGTYGDREKLRRSIVTAIHGRRVPIIDPDDPERYLLGRVVTKKVVNNLAYMTFDVEATCDPWRYAVEETVRQIPVSGTVSAVLNNDGDLTVCPTLVVDGTIDITYGDEIIRKTSGTYKVADLRLRHGANVLTLTGRGSVTFLYREAVL